MPIDSFANNAERPAPGLFSSCDPRPYEAHTGATAVSRHSRRRAGCLPLRLPTAVTLFRRLAIDHISSKLHLIPTPLPIIHLPSLAPSSRHPPAAPDFELLYRDFLSFTSAIVILHERRTPIPWSCHHPSKSSYTTIEPEGTAASTHIPLLFFQHSTGGRS